MIKTNIYIYREIENYQIYIYDNWQIDKTY